MCWDHSGLTTLFLVQSNSAKFNFLWGKEIFAVKIGKMILGTIFIVKFLPVKCIKKYTSTIKMAYEHCTDQYHQIKAQEVTRQDNKPVFAVTLSKFSTSIPKENLCFVGRDSGPASTLYPEKNLCFGKQSRGPTTTLDKSY